MRKDKVCPNITQKEFFGAVIGASDQLLITPEEADQAIKKYNDEIDLNEKLRSELE